MVCWEFKLRCEILLLLNECGSIDTINSPFIVSMVADIDCLWMIHEIKSGGRPCQEKSTYSKQWKGGRGLGNETW